MNDIEKASRFVDLQILHTVLPPDDLDLPADMVQERYEQLFYLDDEFIEKQQALLMTTQISPNFHNQIIFNSRQDRALGMMSIADVYSNMKRRYKIEPGKGLTGFFDPYTVFQAENQYFVDHKEEIEIHELSGVNTGVNILNWENYLLDHFWKVGVGDSK